MIKKLCLLIIAFVSVLSTVKAQQDPIYTQYMFDKVAANPAFAGAINEVNTSLAYRQQLAGFDGAPQTAKLTFSAPLQTYSMGLGVRAYSDRLGASNITGFNLIYAYHLGFGDGKLSFGLEGGFINYMVDFNSLIKTDDIDPALLNGNGSAFIPDASFSTIYHNEKWYAGAAVFHLIGSKIDFTDINRSITGQLNRQFNVLAGYSFKLNSDFNLEPSLFFKSIPGVFSQTDINANITWKNMFSLGGSYRTQGGYAALVRLKFAKQYVFAYSYDVITTPISDYARANHEIMVAYRIALLPPARNKLIHPRFYF